MLLKLQERLRQQGIELHKVPAGGWQKINVFRLAAESLMAKHGDSLSFVQVGANDGVFSDPIRDYILERGWHGILIEPQPEVFVRLKSNYAGHADKLIFEQVAIGPEGSLTLFRPPKAYADALGLSVVSADSHEAARSLGIRESQLERIDVPSIPLTTVLDKHGWSHFDVLQIDVEGLDWMCLQSLDFARFRPRLIQFESGHLPRDQITAATRALNGLGYDVHFGGYKGDTVALHRGWNARRGQVGGPRSRAANDSRTSSSQPAQRQGR